MALSIVQYIILVMSKKDYSVIDNEPPPPEVKGLMGWPATLQVKGSTRSAPVLRGLVPLGVASKQDGSSRPDLSTN